MPTELSLNDSDELVNKMLVQSALRIASGGKVTEE
jgi:hypothetical protein